MLGSTKKFSILQENVLIVWILSTSFLTAFSCLIMVTETVERIHFLELLIC